MKSVLLVLVLMSCTVFAENAVSAVPESVKKDKPGTEMKNRFKKKQGQGIINNLREKSADVVKEFDKDGDGKLNEAERAAADSELDVKKLQQRLSLARAWRAFNDIDKNRDGILSDDELAESKNVVRGSMDKPGEKGKKSRGRGEMRKRRGQPEAAREK